MAIIFVDSTATGADDGTSWTDAYPSLNTALLAANHAPGDQYLVSGTFLEVVNLAEIAAVTTPTIVQGDDKSGGAGVGNPATFTIDAESTRANCMLSGLGSVSFYYVFKDMRTTGGTGHGISLGSGDNVTFKKCRSDNNVSLGLVADNNVKFEECQFDNNDGGGMLSDDNVVVAGCVAFGNGVHQLWTNAGLFVGCLVYEVGAGYYGIYCDSVGLIMIVNCTIDGENNATNRGINAPHASSRLEVVVNNIVYDCATGIYTSRDLGESAISRSNLLNSNTADYNNFDTFTGEQTGAPSFTSEAGDDYTLQSGSPAKAAGYDAGEIINDVSYMDIGAHQRQEAGAAGAGIIKQAGDGGGMVA